MSDCVFCKIVSKEIPAKVLYTDEQVTAFLDINPLAPTHILIIPNKHISSVNDLKPEDESLMGHIIMVARQVAIEQGIAENGYRLITNTGVHAGQTIFHMHFHLLGGHRMKYPMG
ncbi:MAG TPA: histidine triad nucleotide-binding protein [Anaerolineales bacterium]|nr:histidine triad nucleotide-binding protein [Anaerolineales bacterium]